MKVRLLVGRAGERFSQRPGEVVNVDDADGLRMIALGRAAPVDGVDVETAAIADTGRERKHPKRKRAARKT